MHMVIGFRAATVTRHLQIHYSCDGEEKVHYSFLLPTIQIACSSMFT